MDDFTRGLLLGVLLTFLLCTTLFRWTVALATERMRKTALVALEEVAKLAREARESIGKHGSAPPDKSRKTMFD